MHARSYRGTSGVSFKCTLGWPSGGEAPWKVFLDHQGRRKESRARGADRSKRGPTTLGQQIYPRNGWHPRHFLGNIMGYPLTVIGMNVFSNQILLAFSLYDLRCIILTIRKQIIACKKGTFAPPAPPTEKQEGRLLPPAPLSGVPVDHTL